MDDIRQRTLQSAADSIRFSITASDSRELTDNSSTLTNSFEATEEPNVFTESPDLETTSSDRVVVLLDLIEQKVLQGENASEEQSVSARSCNTPRGTPEGDISGSAIKSTLRRRISKSASALPTLRQSTNNYTSRSTSLTTLDSSTCISRSTTFSNLDISGPLFSETDAYFDIIRTMSQTFQEALFKAFQKTGWKNIKKSLPLWNMSCEKDQKDQSSELAGKTGSSILHSAKSSQKDRSSKSDLSKPRYKFRKCTSESDILRRNTPLKRQISSQSEKTGKYRSFMKASNKESRRSLRRQSSLESSRASPPRYKMRSPQLSSDTDYGVEKIPRSKSISSTASRMRQSIDDERRQRHSLTQSAHSLQLTNGSHSPALTQTEEKDSGSKSNGFNRQHSSSSKKTFHKEHKKYYTGEAKNVVSNQRSQVSKHQNLPPLHKEQLKKGELNRSSKEPQVRRAKDVKRTSRSSDRAGSVSFSNGNKLKTKQPFYQSKTNGSSQTMQNYDEYSHSRTLSSLSTEPAETSNNYILQRSFYDIPRDEDDHDSGWHVRSDCGLNWKMGDKFKITPENYDIRFTSNLERDYSPVKWEDIVQAREKCKNWLLYNTSDGSPKRKDKLRFFSQK